MDLSSDHLCFVIAWFAILPEPVRSALVCLLVLSLELHKGYNMLVCMHSSDRFKENSTNEIR